jgi:hypothetical protein
MFWLVRNKFWTFLSVLAGNEDSPEETAKKENEGTKKSDAS